MVYVAAGLLNPYGLKLVLVSAVAASFGGTSGLAWMSQLLRDEKRYPPATTRLDLAPSTAWALAGLVSLVLFVVLMGRGIRF
jgi:hypothetical protein